MNSSSPEKELLKKEAELGKITTKDLGIFKRFFNSSTILGPLATASSAMTVLYVTGKVSGQTFAGTVLTTAAFTAGVSAYSIYNRLAYHQHGKKVERAKKEFTKMISTHSSEILDKFLSGAKQPEKKKEKKLLH